MLVFIKRNAHLLKTLSTKEKKDKKIRFDLDF